MKLLDPINYVDLLIRYNKINYLTDNYLKIMKVEAYINCKWGWYALYPINMTVGYWFTHDGRDDLGDMDIGAWNKLAEETIEKYNKLKAFT